MSEHEGRPKLAQDYEITKDGLSIDGKPFPWWVGIEGPKVEAIDEYHHWLWVPIMVKKPAPEFWDGRGEPVEVPEDAQNTLSGSNTRSLDPS